MAIVNPATTFPNLPKPSASVATDCAVASIPPLNLPKPPSAPLVNALPKLATPFIASFVAFSMRLLAASPIAFDSASDFAASVIPSVKLRVASVAEENPPVMDSKTSVILVSLRIISSSELIVIS